MQRERLTSYESTRSGAVPFDPAKGLVEIQGVHNLISYRTYLWVAIGYLALAFGVLWVSFALYGLRVQGLARFRMLSISGGFFLIFLVVGMIPLLLFSNPSLGAIQQLLRVLRYLVLASAPLLLLGFAPPGWVARRFGASGSFVSDTSAR